MSRDYRRKDYQIEEEEKALAKEEPMEPKPRNGVIRGAINVNIRSEPSLESKAIATVPEGTKVTIHESDGSFHHVSYTASEDSPTIDGYVLFSYCVEVDP